MCTGICYALAYIEKDININLFSKFFDPATHLCLYPITFPLACATFHLQNELCHTILFFAAGGCSHGGRSHGVQYGGCGGGGLRGRDVGDRYIY